MADLQKTQAQWTDFFREFTEYMNPARLVIEQIRRFRQSRIIPLEQFEEPTGLISNWAFTGAKRGDNISEAGQLFIDVTDENPGANQALIEVWEDSAKSSLVASGSGNNSTTITLAEQNNSGLSGTVDIGVIIANINDIVLSLQIDERLKADAAFQTDQIGLIMKGKFGTLMDNSDTTLSSLLTTIQTDIETNFILTRMADFLQSTTTLIISATESADTNGDQQVTFAGLLFELSDSMEDESVAGVQSVLPNTVTTGTPNFDPDNTGSGALGVTSTRESAVTGTIEILCTAGVDTTLEESFSVNAILTDGGVVVSGITLQISKQWESAVIGARLQLTRTITDTLDGSNQVSTYIVNGESLTNTDGGDIYQDLVDVAGTRTLTWYSDSARLLITALGSRVGDGVVTMVEQNTSGLSGSALIAFTVDDTDMVVNLNAFALNDRITMSITNDEAGILQTLIRSIWTFALPSNASPTIPDDLVEEGVDHFIAES